MIIKISFYKFKIFIWNYLKQKSFIFSLLTLSFEFSPRLQVQFLSFFFFLIRDKKKKRRNAESLFLCLHLIHDSRQTARQNSRTLKHPLLVATLPSWNPSSPLLVLTLMLQWSSSDCDWEAAGWSCSDTELNVHHPDL